MVNSLIKSLDDFKDCVRRTKLPKNGTYEKNKDYFQYSVGRMQLVMDRIEYTWIYYEYDETIDPDNTKVSISTSPYKAIEEYS